MWSSLVYVLLLATPLLATNTAGEPTDITNWPACAQKCIPQGFGPPADCGSLKNLTCICQQGIFTNQIASCERFGCTSQERTDIGTLSERLCAPVGGFGTSLLATFSAIATQFSISTTPTLAPSVTAVSQASSLLATATAAPNLGNPANILSYPKCAQICNTQILRMAAVRNSSYGDLNNIQILCGPEFRSATSGCQIASCSPGDLQTTSILSQQLCGPLYNSNATLGSSVSSAIASATAAAKAAIDGKDPTNLAVYPACAQKCITPNNFQGCGALSNLQCVCQGVPFNQAVGPCELSTCSSADLQTITFLADKLCAPASGILTSPSNSTGSNGTTNGSTTVPFTGDAMVSARANRMELVAVGLVFILGVFVL